MTFTKTSYHFSDVNVQTVVLLTPFLADDTESSESGKLSETLEVAKHLSRTRLVCLLCTVVIMVCST